MRNSLGPLLRRATVGGLALVSIWTPGGALAAGAPPSAEAESVPFAQRYHARQHGGIVRAANAAVSCRTAPTTRADAAVPAVSAVPAVPVAPAVSAVSAVSAVPAVPVAPAVSAVRALWAAPDCPAVREGQAAVNGDFDMFYVDVDSDPNTYNSSQAEVRLPGGAQVTYARLYWGGNLRVGEQKPPEDNGRVLIAEPGGQYKEVLADTLVGHRVNQSADAFQASADVTGLVRSSGQGLYTVAQINVAMGRSTAGAWGGWTLVVVYENPAEPLRDLSLWDGFGPLGAGAGHELRLRELDIPQGAYGRVGLVAYDGDCGRSGDSLTLSSDSGAASTLTNAVNPADDVLNSTISEPGEAPAARVPAYVNTLGYDSDVFDLGEGLRRGGDQLTVRLVSHRDAAWAGALFVAVDTRTN
ncbi:DUF3344 domain-containing protein [Streptomyces sp. NBC_01275]|uniref:DUF3344 domain-containing protein n=1 Tax=Streptomyces sp. NBC_01275 TaxID=2903807 RepID=UPI0022574D0E|nr:DUF3344 domain-containing protein [Streptomyces sp. NBC_01275]MCX4762253.1 DUF3344 domain-containing protein [Streptomyces sp. NBC_01275]